MTVRAGKWGYAVGPEGEGMNGEAIMTAIAATEHAGVRCLDMGWTHTSTQGLIRVRRVCMECVSRSPVKVDHAEKRHTLERDQDINEDPSQQSQADARPHERYSLKQPIGDKEDLPSRRTGRSDVTLRARRPGVERVREEPRGPALLRRPRLGGGHGQEVVPPHKISPVDMDLLQAEDRG